MSDAASVSVTVTGAAASGPALLTTRLYVTSDPGVTVPVWFLAIVTSASAATTVVVLAGAVLFKASESPVSVTLTVLVRAPQERCAVTVMWNTQVPPAGIAAGSVQVNTGVAFTHPASSLHVGSRSDVVRDHDVTSQGWQRRWCW